MIDVESQYPIKIDPILFFQDNALDKSDIINTYNNLISQNQYNKANEFIIQHENIYRHSAGYFNAIENRIEALQEYLLTKRSNEPFIYSDVEPTSTQTNENMIWIE